MTLSFVLAMSITPPSFDLGVFNDTAKSDSSVLTTPSNFDLAMFTMLLSVNSALLITLLSVDCNVNKIGRTKQIPNLSVTEPIKYSTF